MTKSPPTTRLGKAAKPKPPKPSNGGVRLSLFYAVFTGLLATNILTLVGFLLSPDIAALINGNYEQSLTSYQDRIGQLRVDVDRLHSRQFTQTGNINLQLQELAQQQEVLTEQHQYVKALADKATALGLGPIIAPTTQASTASPGSKSAAGVKAMITPASVIIGENEPAELEKAGHQIRQMMDDSRVALATISAVATTSTNDILDQLHSVGIKPKLSDAGATSSTDAIGGPFLPPEDGVDDTAMLDQANAVVTALAQYKDAREAIIEAPIHMPLKGHSRVSSGFGNRTDPFTRTQGFHPGIDYPWPTGTPVMSAGAGTVSYAGQINGYGNAIDIDHGNGIMTRYGHLSAILVHKGEVVDTGTPIGRVGSTGRSTGPHLHFEIRRDNRPVNPNFYLDVGKSLAHFLTASTGSTAQG